MKKKYLLNIKIVPEKPLLEFKPPFMDPVPPEEYVVTKKQKKYPKCIKCGNPFVAIKGSKICLICLRKKDKKMV